MALTDLMLNPGPDLFYDSDFRNVLEDHMTFLRQNYCQTVVLAPDEAYQWRSDFFGLLQAKGIPRQYHWLMMRINNYTSPNQFPEDAIAILQPDFTVIDKIAQSHNSLPRIR